MALDQRARALLAPGLDRLGRRLARAGASPAGLTATGLVLGVGAAVLLGLGAWHAALALWLVSRLADGLDGPVARAGSGGTDLGGFVDILADFVAYGAWVVGLGVVAPSARVACLVLLLAYYVNGSAFLALSSLAERRRQRVAHDGRSLQFVAGLAEGTETIVVHAVLALLVGLAPATVAATVWVWAAVVGVTVLQRVAEARRHLGD